MPVTSLLLPGLTRRRLLRLGLGAWPAALAALAPARGAALEATTAEELTAISRLLAGLPVDDKRAALKPVMATEAWRRHRSAAHSGAERLQARLDRMHAWAAKNLVRAAGNATLLYPFSGPDFVNAYALFPDADTYLFFSLEPPGEVPHLEAMDEAALAAFFADLRHALNDLVALNFFITPNMKETLQTSALQGTVPLMLTMMGLLGLEVDAVEGFDPWPERTRALATARARPGLPSNGVRIAFTNPGTGRRQRLIYLALDVSDAQLHFYPEFLPWLASFSRPSVLLKSASYLLHGEHFRQLRTALLADADAIVQDDTGFPFRLLGAAGFDVTLFGQYEHPVKLFEGRFQPDLEAAYAARGAQAALPFPFGYNWRKEGRSGLQMAGRRAPAR